MQSKKRRIAVVGAGISGLTAAYILQRSNSVTVYEADDRLGGHAHTQNVDIIGGRRIAIDTGFITFSHKSYPSLSRLLAELQVESDPTRFSFSICCDGCGLEYTVTRDIRGLIPHVRAADSAKYLSMLAQIPTFNLMARRLARQATDGATPSLEDFLMRGKFTKYFIQHYAVPLVSALWSCAPELASTYPARYVAHYLEHHGLLSIYKSHDWRTVRGGSQKYVERIAQILTDVRSATPVQSVRRTSAGVCISDFRGQTEMYDAVVMATHADQSLRLLADATEAERYVLGSFTYSRNLVTLHTDTAVLSPRRRSQGTWNYRLASCAPPSGVAQITYHMNKLHGLDVAEDFLVTLNGSHLVNRDHIRTEVMYEHPIDSAASVAARRLLPSLATTRTVFAGSYHGWSSHEDGCRSGADAASSLGAHW